MQAPRKPLAHQRNLTIKQGTQVMIMMRLSTVIPMKDPQYAIFMETQAHLEAEGLGDFLPNLCLLITSEFWKRMFPPVHGYSELCQLMLEIRLIT